MSLRRLCMLLGALSLGWLAAAPAAAWWEYGHQTIATIAMRTVQPRTRASIRRLLAHQAALETPTCPARTIEEAAVWPDCVKTLGDRFAYLFPWHFQDVEICRPFDLKAACPFGNCAATQIARAQRMVADHTLPVRDRVMALALLVHIVGDLHQPLHGAEHDGDQGGNTVRANYGQVTGSNLHAVWDGLLAERAISTPPAGAAGILASIPPAERPHLAAGTIADWSRETWALARTAVYGTVEVDPCGPTPTGPVALSESAIERLVPVVRLQIARGGLRLARLLDEALDGDHPEVAHPPRAAKGAG